MKRRPFMNYRRLSPREEADYVARAQAGAGPERDRQYEAQLQAMLENADKWRAANPDREALVQFNYAPHIGLIMPISNAIKEKFVTTNDAGLELVKALHAWDYDEEPTVNMVRCVLEYERPKPQTATCPCCQKVITVRGGIVEKGDTERGPATPGALNLCMHCGGVSVFNDDMTLRPMPPEEFEALPEDLRGVLSTAIEHVKQNPPPEQPI